MLTVAILLLLLIAIIIKKYVLKPANFPTGPPRIPILGSTPFLPDIFNLQFMLGVRERFGDLFACYLGHQPVVVLSDAKMIREVYKMTEAAGRMPNRPFDDVRAIEDGGSVTGVIQSKGELWEEQRRFSLRSLRDMGMGKSNMDEVIIDEVIRLCDRFSKTLNEPITLNKKMNLSIVSALWTIMTSETMDLDDPQSLKIIDLLDKAIRDGAGTPTTISTLFPDLYKYFSSDYADFKGITDNVKDLFQPHIAEHQSTLDPQNPKDFIDQYLIEMAQSKSGSSFHGVHGHTSLHITLFDLFLAGTETTSSTLSWIFLYMLNYPDIKEKVHQEIDSVVGEARSVRSEDRDSLPYTEAVILESMRFSCLVPLGVPRSTTSDLHYGGFTIPKNSTLIANILKVHYDPTAWTDPYDFKPERFIDENGKVIRYHSHLMPFSVGRRFCLGQSLAEKELLLFFGGIMQRFNLSIPKGYTLPDHKIEQDTSSGFIRLPPVYHIQMTKRNVTAY